MDREAMFKVGTPEELDKLIREGAPNVKVSEDLAFLDDIAALAAEVRELGGLVERAIAQEEEYAPSSLEEAEGLGRLHENLNTLAIGMFRHAKLIELTLKLFGR